MGKKPNYKLRESILKVLSEPKKVGKIWQSLEDKETSYYSLHEIMKSMKNAGLIKKVGQTYMLPEHNVSNIFSSASKERHKDRYLYIIRNKETGNLKVGVTENLKTRLSVMQTNNDCDLELVASWKGKTHLEAPIHSHFRDSSVREEWLSGRKVSVKDITEFINKSE